MTITNSILYYHTVHYVSPPAPPKSLIEVARQNEPLYVQLLTKLKNENCESVTDKENNSFYMCKDGTKITMINWTRGDRKGVVTREYDPKGNLILIYGHPNDVY